MSRIIAIVEGHGEVQAVPNLVRRIAEACGRPLPQLPTPIRIKRQKVLHPGEFERVLELAARQAGPEGGILAVLDADEDCPRKLADVLRLRARQARPDRRFRVAVAKQEFEAWFLAALESLAGQRGIPASATSPADPEDVGNPKARLGGWMSPGRYSPPIHQPALAACLDLDAAVARSPSFAKFKRDVESLLSEEVAS